MKETARLAVQYVTLGNPRKAVAGVWSRGLQSKLSSWESLPFALCENAGVVRRGLDEFPLGAWRGGAFELARLLLQL